jgi:hypothetical protein
MTPIATSRGEVGMLAFAVCGKRRRMCVVSPEKLIEPLPTDSAFQPKDVERHHLAYGPLEDLCMPAREIRKLDPTHVLDVANVISTPGFHAPWCGSLSFRAVA